MAFGFPTVGDTIQVAVGDRKTEPLVVTPDVYLGSNNTIYASKDSGQTWWPIPTAGAAIDLATVHYYLTGQPMGKYERHSREGAFYMQTHIL